MGGVTIVKFLDPADRFIVATAVVYGLTLITSDGKIIESNGLPVMPNR